MRAACNHLAGSICHQSCVGVGIVTVMGQGDVPCTKGIEEPQIGKGVSNLMKALNADWGYQLMAHVECFGGSTTVEVN